MIDKYIKELLQQQTSVSIPQLGTFKTVQENAQTDATQHVIQPPHKKVLFSTEIQQDDALRDAVMLGEHIDQEDYELQVNKFMESIDAQIITFGEYKIKDLGSLTKNEQGEFIFKPQGESLGDSFGLPPVDAQPIARTETQKATPKNEPKPQKATSGNNNTLWMIIIPLICLLAFLVFLSTHKDGLKGLKTLFSSSKTEEIISANDPNTDNNITEMNPDDTNEGGNPLGDTNDEQPTTDLPEGRTENPITPAETIDNQVDNQSTSAQVSDIVQGKFYIVAGSFSTVKSAQTLLTKMASVQNLKIVPYSAKNMFRVVIGEFEDQATATAKMNELTATYGSMWITKM